MNTNRTVIIPILSFVAGVALSGLFLANKSHTSSESNKALRHYAINVAYSAQPFWTEVATTARQIAKVDPSIDIAFGGPQDNDTSKQIEEIEDLIARKVDGIVLFPADPKALAPTIDKAVGDGIPVVTLFSDVANSRMTVIGGPEKESAQVMAQRVFQSDPEFQRQLTKVLISYNKPGETVTDERLAGIKEVVSNPKYRNTVKVVQVVSDYGNDAKAAEAIAPVLAKHKDIKVIFCLNARGAIGAITALKEIRKENGDVHKAGDVIVTAWDSDADVLDNIRKGWIFSTSVLNSSLCTQIALGLLQAKSLDYLYPASLRLREMSLPAVPNEILIPETLVDKTNVAAYCRR